MTVLRINVWSGPRNVSTALMYAFRQRPDTTVVDEPLYGHYLRMSGAVHPGGDEVMAAMPDDGDTVVRKVMLGPCATPVLVCKQMAHHLVDLELDFLDACTNVLLIRDPAEVLASYVKQVEEPTLEGLGYPALAMLADRSLARGATPLVVDSRLLLLDPPGVLGELCDQIGLPFDPAMLSWPAGPKPEDGVWAPHWYAGVHGSTGFAPYRSRSEALPARLVPILEQAAPIYERLVTFALGG